MFYQIYKFFGSILVILILPFFYLHPRGRLRFAERLGIWGKLPQEVIWIHAASVGEVNGLIPVIKHLRQNQPYPILLTATSASGLERAKNVVEHTRLLPFDSPLFLGQAIKNLKPRCFIFGETELWPHLLHVLNAMNTPIFMANATITDFSWRSYLLINRLFPKLLNKIDFIAAANEKSYQRFIQLGATAEKIELIGNTKYCQTGAAMTQALPKHDRHSEYFANSLPIVVLGSLRPEEETYWLSTLKSYRNRINFVIAPRHPEKTEYFESKLQAVGIKYVLESNFANLNHRLDNQLLLIDSLGKLTSFYEIAKLAFIGGSLVKGIGGHNPLEAAALAVPVCIGPECNNVRELIDEMHALNAVVIINSGEQIEKLLEELLTQPDRLKAIGQNGFNYYLQKQDALPKLITAIERVCFEN